MPAAPTPPSMAMEGVDAPVAKPIHGPSDICSSHYGKNEPRLRGSGDEKVAPENPTPQVT